MLLGFDKIEKSLLENFNQSKLHHGLLILGNKGIGKSEFALEIAKKILLYSSENQSEDLRKINSGSHPDLLIIKKDEKKRDIVVDAVREITGFLSMTAAICKHKVIIIDAIDDLNKASSNAILKTLEEPPANVFLFLINHNSSKVLDTIKSRCRTIKIPSPSFDDFENILKKNIENISDQEVKILSKISDNSIGTALAMYNYNALDLYEKIVELIESKDAKEIYETAKIISADEEIWSIFEKLINFYFYNLATKKQQSDKIFRDLEKVNNLLSATKNLNLDKSQTISNIILSIA